VTVQKRQDDGLGVTFRRCDACGLRFAVKEVVFYPRRERDAQYVKAKGSEYVSERSRRASLRRQARAEAAETGRPVEQIYAEWGVA
jgi:hypothetical protein